MSSAQLNYPNNNNTYFIDPSRIRWDQNSFQLGSGSFGTVVKGRCDGEPVALKRAHGSQRPSERLQLSREIRRYARLRNPNITQFIGESITEEKQLVLVFELMEGGSLADVLPAMRRKQSPFTALSLLRIATHMARGLRFTHAENLSHGDLKPANVLLSQHVEIERIPGFSVFEGRAKLTDYGLSRCLDTTNSTAVLNEGPTGTIAYLAPEAYDGLPDLESAKCADTFSFAITMWEIIAMDLPYRGKTIPEIYRYVSILKKRPQWSQEMLERVPIDFIELIEKCWAHSPQDRPSMEYVTEELERILEKYGGGSGFVGNILDPQSSEVESLFNSTIATSVNFHLSMSNTNTQSTHEAQSVTPIEAYMDNADDQTPSTAPTASAEHRASPEASELPLYVQSVPAPASAPMWESSTGHETNKPQEATPIKHAHNNLSDLSNGSQAAMPSYPLPSVPPPGANPLPPPQQQSDVSSSSQSAASPFLLPLISSSEENSQQQQGLGVWNTNDMVRSHVSGLPGFPQQSQQSQQGVWNTQNLVQSQALPAQTPQCNTTDQSSQTTSNPMLPVDPLQSMQHAQNTHYISSAQISDIFPPPHQQQQPATQQQHAQNPEYVSLAHASYNYPPPHDPQQQQQQQQQQDLVTQTQKSQQSSQSSQSSQLMTNQAPITVPPLKPQVQALATHSQSTVLQNVQQAIYEQDPMKSYAIPKGQRQDFKKELSAFETEAFSNLDLNDYISNEDLYQGQNDTVNEYTSNINYLGTTAGVSQAQHPPLPPSRPPGARGDLYPSMVGDPNPPPPQENIYPSFPQTQPMYVTTQPLNLPAALGGVYPNDNISQSDYSRALISPSISSSNMQQYPLSVQQQFPSSNQQLSYVTPQEPPVQAEAPRELAPEEVEIRSICNSSSPGDFEKLLEIAQFNHEDVDVQREVATAFAKMTSDDGLARRNMQMKDISEENVLAIIQVLHRDLLLGINSPHANKTMVSNAMLCLGNLAIDPQCGSYIRSSNMTLRAVLEAMGKFSNESTIQEKGCFFLAVFAANPEGRDMVGQHGGIISALAALRSSSAKNEFRVIQQSLACIRNMVWQSEINANQLYSNGGAEALIKAMKISSNTQIQRDESLDEVYRCLATCSFYPNLRSALGAAGGGEGLIANMNRKRADVKFQLTGCVGLGALCIENEPNTQRIVAAGGVEIIMVALKTYGRQHSGLFYQAIRALRLISATDLTAQDRIISNGIFEYLDQLHKEKFIPSSKESEALIAEVLGLYSNLSTGTRGSKLLKDSSACFAYLELLKSKSWNKSPVLEANGKKAMSNTKKSILLKKASNFSKIGKK